jgi:hypothetical protein
MRNDHHLEGEKLALSKHMVKFPAIVNGNKK